MICRYRHETCMGRPGRRERTLKMSFNRRRKLIFLAMKLSVFLYLRSKMPHLASLVFSVSIFPCTDYSGDFQIVLHYRTRTLCDTIFLHKLIFIQLIQNLRLEQNNAILSYPPLNRIHVFITHFFMTCTSIFLLSVREPPTLPLPSDYRTKLCRFSPSTIHNT
jgi:hypothetical protein